MYVLIAITTSSIFVSIAIAINNDNRIAQCSTVALLTSLTAVTPLYSLCYVLQSSSM